MKNLILLFLFTTSFHFGQNITKEIIIGSWKVVDILPSEMDKVPHMKDVITGFKNATFTFNQNNSFKFSTTKSSKTFNMVTEMLINTKWNLITEKNKVKIGTLKDNYSIMGIQIGTIENKIVFLLDESQLYLVVEKINNN